MRKTLITITTCNRLSEVKKYIWDYIDFCNQNENFDFLLSLDGTSDDYLQFCKEYQTPLLYSNEREGVGLSKNRVLKQFPGYDYYFFIEDDIELINSAIFNKYIKASEQTGFEHLNHFSLHADTHKTKNTMQTSTFNVVSKMTGGGYFNFFTKKGIEAVGGFHDCFAKIKRYGHTEHTLRFVNAGLQEYPFNGIREASNDLLIHFPPHVTPVEQKKFKNGISDYEQNMIDKKLSFYPIKTISPFQFNGYDMNFNSRVQEFLEKHKKKYPLTTGKARRKALGEYYFFRFRATSGIQSLGWLLLANLLYPLHPDFKHYLKVKFFKNAK